MTLPNNARPLRVLVVDDERLPRAAPDAAAGGDSPHRVRRRVRERSVGRRRDREPAARSRPAGCAHARDGRARRRAGAHGACAVRDLRDGVRRVRAVRVRGACDRLPPEAGRARAIRRGDRAGALARGEHVGRTASRAAARAAAARAAARRTGAGRAGRAVGRRSPAAGGCRSRPPFPVVSWSRATVKCTSWR